MSFIERCSLFGVSTDMVSAVMKTLTCCGGSENLSPAEAEEEGGAGSAGCSALSTTPPSPCFVILS